MSKKFYLTTAIPYVNARPHVGHALEYVIADVIRRYNELAGNKVRIVSGADENALKNVQAAEKEGVSVKDFLDRNSKTFEEFYKLLEVNLDEFRRGSDQKLHWPGVSELWKLVEKSGNLYKKKYHGLYCVGCESFKTEKELVNGKCPEHDRVPDLVEEENYFFKLSKYQEKLLKLIETNEYKITPEKRKNEALSFLKGGLEDFSVSRSNERARGVGVPVPGDPSQKIYVWFDALTIYMTASGYGYNKGLWETWWPADLHIIGKDIFRFHAFYWPAMLLAANLPLPKELLVHGFITSGGRKMSKTIGNVIDPYEIIEKYGVEPLRYFLLSQIPTLDDGDFTEERFKEVYNSDLANGLGNLVARVSGLSKDIKIKDSISKPKTSKEVEKGIKEYQLNLALGAIWTRIRSVDVFINENKVWSLTGKKKEEAIGKLVEEIRQIAFDLRPFLPKTAEKIENGFDGTLFPRLD